MLEIVKKLFILFFILGFVSCARSKIDQSNPNYGKVDYDEVKSHFSPLPETLIKSHDSATMKRIALGKKLYFEKALSLANDISCNSCHLLDRYGVDNLPTSPGHKGQHGDRNSPSVYNAAVHFSQFWDGRAKDLAAQAEGPVLNPVEMAMPNPSSVIKRLKERDDYVALFKAAFPKEKKNMTFKNMAKAIGEFEKKLLTPSRFDLYLKGNQKALSMDEKEGLRNFIKIGCVSCHDGVGVGGGSFQTLGLVVPYDTEDLGRYKVTKDEEDKFMFKVPSLRNIEKTSPYFHDGSIASLKEAVILMGKYQLGADLTESEVESILAFLRSLTGKLPDIKTL